MRGQVKGRCRSFICFYCRYMLPCAVSDMGKQLTGMAYGNACCCTHVQVPPPGLIKQVLHLALHNHNGLLEVQEQRCRRETAASSELLARPSTLVADPRARGTHKG